MKKKIFGFIAVILIFLSFVIAGCGSTEPKSPEIKNIGSEELQSMIDSNKNLLVVDVREKDEYDQGHINNSIMVPTSELQDRMSELPKEKTIALVCASGARSAQAAQFLVQSGYTEVYNLEGGLSAWPYQLTK